MRRSIESLRRRLASDGLLPPSRQFGDWLDPDAPVERPWEAKTDSTYLANAFLVHSARLSAHAADIAGEAEWAAQTRSLADAVAAATWRRWSEHAVTTQTGCAVGLRFGIVADAERSTVADALARLVRDADGRVSTGFLGTPLVLPALADAGRFEEAYLMLLRDRMPSWLYQVRQGATTVWERWDAILPDGSIHPGTMRTPPGMDNRATGEPHMLSFNHYAYGAVIDWVYRYVAGLAPSIGRPGYRHVLMAYGQLSIAWRIDGDGVFRAEVELPFGSSGTFVAPAMTASQTEVDGAVTSHAVDLGPGRHVIAVQQPRIIIPT
jgi:alpha-L-rhamnosidase